MPIPLQTGFDEQAGVADSTGKLGSNALYDPNIHIIEIITVFMLDYQNTAKNE
jgi:hypothetical protein